MIDRQKLLKVLVANLRRALWHLENPGVPIAEGALDNIRTAVTLGETAENPHPETRGADEHR